MHKVFCLLLCTQKYRPKSKTNTALLISNRAFPAKNMKAQPHSQAEVYNGGLAKKRPNEDARFREENLKYESSAAVENRVRAARERLTYALVARLFMNILMLSFK